MVTQTKPAPAKPGFVRGSAEAPSATPPKPGREDERAPRAGLAAGPVAPEASEAEPSAEASVPPAPPKSDRHWLLFFIPTLTGFTIMVAFLTDGYLAGLYLRAATLHFFTTAVESLTLLLGAVALPIATAKWFAEKPSLTRAGKIQAVCMNLVLIPLLVITVFALQTVYVKGLDAAYAAMDPARIALDCHTLADGSAFTIKRSDPEFANLPAYLQQLSPEVVKATATEIRLVFNTDPYASTQDEGVLVPLKPLEKPVAEYAQSHHFKTLLESPPVFRFRPDGF